MDEPTGDISAPAASAPAPADAGPKLELFDFIKESVQAATDAPASADAELLFVGSKNSGKSTLVQAFLQKDEAPKPSTPLVASPLHNTLEAVTCIPIINLA